MIISETKIDQLLMSNGQDDDVVYWEDWKPNDDLFGKSESRTFVLQVGASYFRGEISRTYNMHSQHDEYDTVQPTGYIYSHEGKGVKAEEVKRVCVKENGKRTIKYEKV